MEGAPLDVVPCAVHSLCTVQLCMVTLCLRACSLCVSDSVTPWTI